MMNHPMSEDHDDVHSAIPRGSHFQEAGAELDLTGLSVQDNPTLKSIVLGKTPDIVIPFNKPCLFPECLQAVQQAFDQGKVSGDGINTKLCTEFFAKRFGYKHCLFTPSCTAALEMAALILDLGAGDEVICPSFTFVSTANAFCLRGVTIVLTDSNQENPNVDIDDVLDKVTPQTKAIVVVHYAGVPLDLTRLQRTGIPIIEDCAHALGSIDPVTQDVVGKTGCLATFSYHETKNLGIGEGGTLVVNDRNLWGKAQMCREMGTNRTAFREGRADYYTWHSLGSSYLMSDVDAGILWGCLLHYNEIQEKRAHVWNFYDECIWYSSLFQKPLARKSRANAHMYYLQFHDKDTRQAFQAFMKSRGILVTSHYMALDASPFVKSQNERLGRLEQQKPCINAACWSDTLVRLPVHFELSNDQLEQVVVAVNAFTGNSGGMTLQRASLAHYGPILEIRNQHHFSFLHTNSIDMATHQAFLENHAKTYRVAVDESEHVVGFIGHVDGDVRLATQNSLLRSGVGTFMWTAFLQEFPHVTVQVKRDNERSMGFFRTLGWKPPQDKWDDANVDPVPLVPPKVDP